MSTSFNEYTKLKEKYFSDDWNKENNKVRNNMKVIMYLDGEHNTVEVKDKIKSVLPDANYMIFGVEDENALTIIKKQEAEIERLTKETMNMAISIETCQAEAIKEFAERLIEQYPNKYLVWGSGSQCRPFKLFVDNLVKERVDNK